MKLSLSVLLSLYFSSSMRKENIYSVKDVKTESGSIYGEIGIIFA